MSGSKDLELVRERVRACQAGDSHATAWLARRATRLALRTAAAILQSRDDAGDIAQDVAVDVLRSLGRLRDPAAFDPWVHRITVRHASRALGRRRRRARTELAVEGPAAAIDPVAWEPDLDGVLAAREALQQGLATLPVRQRIALVLRYVHDLSDDDIAAALGCRPGTVHALLSRGRAALRRELVLDTDSHTVTGACG